MSRLPGRIVGSYELAGGAERPWSEHSKRPRVTLKKYFQCLSVHFDTEFPYSFSTGYRPLITRMRIPRPHIAARKDAAERAPDQA
jgi:hypothetical protein